MLYKTEGNEYCIHRAWPAGRPDPQQQPATRRPATDRWLTTTQALILGVIISALIFWVPLALLTAWLVK